MGTQCLAFDLGASGGRLMLGDFDGKTINISEIHRFENEMTRMNGILYWDIFKLFTEIKTGLKKAAARGIKTGSIGIDTWGVDYALMDNKDNIIGNTISYRDSRTDDCITEAGSVVGLDKIYESTGIQFLNFNTLFQLMADKKMRPAAYNSADKLLFMPDLLGFLLSGAKYNEYTVMSTGQLLCAKSKKPDFGLLGKLGLRQDLFCDMVMPGTHVGNLKKDIMEETGLDAFKVIAVGSHDTASAVAGTPLQSGNSAYLSCGTWSLLGIESNEPFISAESYSENFTNEGGVCGSIRFLKNINGLWIIQQLRKSVGNISFPDIINAAENAKRKHFIIDPNDKRFNSPVDMYAEIVGYCNEAGMGTPENLGEVAIAVYNGITTEYKNNIDKLERLTGKDIDCINMIGGGIRDKLICEMTAEATGKTIAAGPVEGSVYGNIIMQLIALGELDSLSRGRDLVNASCEKTIYTGGN